jgi:hypothetical protein
MAIQISIKDPKKAIALLQFLITSELINSFEVVEGTLGDASMSEEDAAFFDTFYGNSPELSMSKMRNYLNVSKNE